MNRSMRAACQIYNKQKNTNNKIKQINLSPCVITQNLHQTHSKHCTKQRTKHTQKKKIKSKLFTKKQQKFKLKKLSYNTSQFDIRLSNSSELLSFVVKICKSTLCGLVTKLLFDLFKFNS